MSALAAYELQSAVYTALTNDTALMAKIDAVWDEPDSAAAYPYVTMGDGKTRDKSSKTHDGTEHDFVLDIWSNDPGRMEVKEIMGLIHDVLHNQSLTVASNALVFIRFDNAEDFRDTEGAEVLYHGVMRFKAITAEA